MLKTWLNGKKAEISEETILIFVFADLLSFLTEEAENRELEHIRLSFEKTFEDVRFEIFYEVFFEGGKATRLFYDLEPKDYTMYVEIPNFGEHKADFLNKLNEFPYSFEIKDNDYE